MAWNRTLTNLRDVLAGLYPTVQDARRVVEDAGLPPAHIAFDPKPINNWYNILRYADNRIKVRDIAEVAHEEFPENEWLGQYLQTGDIPAIRGPDIADDVDWRGLEDADPLEKIMGAQSTLLPIAFLEVGLRKAQSVARIVRADGSMGSGWLTDDNLLITNHHVLGSEADAAEAIAQFNYQQAPTGIDLAYEEVVFAPDAAFATSKADDWTTVRVAGDANAKWGSLKLQRADVSVKDFVNIIQHPGGGPKQIALYHNVVAYVGQGRIQYLTDTLPGSSGSPVFDSSWRVVALHHSGGWLAEPGTKRTYYRNEGIHVNVLIDGLTEAGLLRG
jgi:V8-like Glu-specific endopeptidase